MKTIKLFILFIMLVSFKQVKSQCLDSIKIANASSDSMTFKVYINSNNDTVNLIIFNRWGQIVKKVINDSIMQSGFYVITYHPSSSLAIDTYYYKFTSHGGCKHNGYVTYLGSSSGIQQYKNSSMVSVYPNPSNGSLVVQSQIELGLIIVYNTIGEIVYQKETKENSIQIDLSNQPAGIYFIKSQNQFIKLIME